MFPGATLKQALGWYKHWQVKLLQVEEKRSSQRFCQGGNLIWTYFDKIFRVNNKVAKQGISKQISEFVSRLTKELWFGDFKDMVRVNFNTMILLRNFFIILKSYELIMFTKEVEL